MRVSDENGVEWLLLAGQRHKTLRGLTHVLVNRCVEAGIAISRLNLGVFAVHPEMAGYAVHWKDGFDEPIEFPVRHEDTLTPEYLDSPIKLLVDTGEPLHFDLADPHAGEQFPVIEEFRSQGMTDYRGFAIPCGESGDAVLTLCTQRQGGFLESEIVWFTRLFPALSLLVDLMETRRLAKTVLTTYLGRHTGKLVLEGKIRRGQGESIEAALWLCDLRGFTAMTNDLGSTAMIDVMNLYFDCIAEAIWNEGGEILKFMGDAILVVFRITDGCSAGQACVQANRAAQAAQQRLSALSEQRRRDGLCPLHAGIALHLGEVIYGNIGAKSRLDFTVMGNAVNFVSRLQSITADLAEPVLFSSEVAAYLMGQVVSVGHYDFKGVDGPAEVYRAASMDSD